MSDTGVLKVDLVADDAALAALAADWLALDAASGARNPFLSWSWTMACRTHIRPGARPFVLTARAADGRLAGVAPLCVERTFGLRVLRFIADGRSDYLGFLSDPAVPGVEPALLEHLAQMADAWDVAVLRHLTADYSALSARLAPAGLGAHETEGTVSSHLVFSGDWDALIAEGPRGPRHARRWVRRFARRGGEVVRIAAPDAAARLDDVCDIEARSWKGSGGTARFQPGPGRDLLRAALESAPDDSMEVWLALDDGLPIAFQINFLTPGRLLYYQGAYDQAHRSAYAGGVLHHHALGRAWGEGRREYDFMAGPEGYKEDWTTDVRSLRYLALHPRTARGHLAYRLLVAPRWALKESALARAAHERLTSLRGRLTKGSS